MPEPLYSYDVFISYKSEQESWAVRLARSLQSFGLTVWRDHEAESGLRVGEEWTVALREAIRQSRCMVVLWSKLLDTQARSVAHQEIAEMARLREEDSNRRFFTVSLDGTPVAGHQMLGAFHSTDRLVELHRVHGDGGGPLASDVTWSVAVKDILQALGVGDITAVRFVTAAMTHAQAVELRDHPETYAQNEEAYRIIVDLLEKTCGFDPDRYGASPDDWRPFPQLAEDATVASLIAHYEQAKQAWLREHPGQPTWIFLSHSDEVLSPVGDRWQAAIDSLGADPCVIILDPVSLLHRYVFDRMMTRMAVHGLRDAFVIGVSPYALQLYADLSALVERAEKGLHELLDVAYRRFQTIHDVERSVCVLGVDHAYQLFRWLQVATEHIQVLGRTPLRARPAAPPLLLPRRGPGAVITRMGQGGM